MQTDNKDKKKMDESENISLPTKKEILEILNQENAPIDSEHIYSQLILILEIKKIKQNLGILKGEYYNGDKLEYRGSLLIPLDKPKFDQPNHFDEIKVGEYKFFGFTLDSQRLQ